MNLGPPPLLGRLVVAGPEIDQTRLLAVLVAGPPASWPLSSFLVKMIGVEVKICLAISDPSLLSMYIEPGLVLGTER